MWRTIFSLAHADNIVSEEEARFMTEKLEGLTLSLEQREVLQADMTLAQNPSEMFEKITDTQDQAEFFTLARNLAMADGEYHASEQGVIAHLQDLQIIKTNIDQMVGNVGLGFEPPQPPPPPPVKKKGFFAILLALLKNE